MSEYELCLSACLIWVILGNWIAVAAFGRRRSVARPLQGRARSPQ